eukprot:6186534-Pleurochrysis_carterae.AAC.1
MEVLGWKERDGGKEGGRKRERERERGGGREREHTGSFRQSADSARMVPARSDFFEALSRIDVDALWAGAGPARMTTSGAQHHIELLAGKVCVSLSRNINRSPSYTHATISCVPLGKTASTQ